ncbi:inositol polyphosphate kinase family protein [Vibrio aquimaris]|uniref:Uncharacterized protein n=1 Tax=Vibrio aquimaris TaxID=2587862 RepID=A0A5P9CN70_9VIBR|nr:inositol polyphosphate kinase family protein [Vibrio aquimaris]QFT27670.1 hypothetical protein FIV01_14885 [Vibrio aquimaris]
MEKKRKKFLGGVKKIGTLGLLKGKKTMDSFVNGEPYQVNSKPIIDLDNIYKYIEGTDTVYIASSLLLAENTQRGDESKIRLMDFAHPVKKNNPMFGEIRKGMLQGILNLRNKLLGKPMSSIILIDDGDIPKMKTRAYGKTEGLELTKKQANLIKN